MKINISLHFFSKAEASEAKTIEEFRIKHIYRQRGFYLKSKRFIVEVLF